MRRMHLLAQLSLAAGLLPVAAAPAVGGPPGGGRAAAVHPDPAVDADGRPGDDERLPNGATARLGTTRLRHGDGLVFAAYLPDGKSLLTVSKDKTVRLWDLATGREVRRFIRGGTPSGRDGHPPSSGRNEAASAGGRMTAKSAMTEPVGVAALSRDGSRVAAADGRFVWLWETATGRRLHAFEVPKPIILLAFSPDGGSLAGVTIDKAITVWNAASGRGETRLAARVSAPEIEDAFNGSFGAVAVSPDLEYLAWNHLDLKALRPSHRLTAVATGQEPRGNPFLKELPPAFAFSSDGRSLLWAGNDQNVHVTEIATGKETLRTEKAGLNGPICGLTLSPDGKTLAVARVVVDKPEIRAELWSMATGKRLHAIVTPDAPESGLIQRFGELIARGRSLAGARAFAPDGTILAVGLGGDAAAVRLFDVATGREIPGPGEGHRSVVEALGVVPGGDRIYTFARGDGVLAWDAASGERRDHIALPEDAEAVAFSADGGRLAAVAGWSKVVVSEVATGRVIRTLEARDLGLGGASNPFLGAGPGIAALALSPDGRTLATRRVMSTDVRLWDVATGKALHILTQSAAPAEAAEAKLSAGEASGVSTPEIAFSPDGAYLAGAGAKWQLCLWEVAGGRTVWEVVLPAGSNVVRLAFSADGRSLAALDADGGVALYEVATGQPRGGLGEAAGAARKGTSAVNLGGVSARIGHALPSGLAFSPDGRRVAASSASPIIRLWDLLTGEELRRFEGDARFVACLGFTPDGRRLISGGSDTTALVWDTARAAGPRAASGPPLDAARLGALWSDLAAPDAARAFAASRELVAAPGQAVAFLKEHLRPTPIPDSGRVASLVAALRDAKFAARQEAEKELEELGEAAGPALREALRGDPPLALRQRVERLLARAFGRVPAGGAIRDLRAIELLERIGSDGARGVLEVMARGAPDARPTRDAKSALARLAAAAPSMR
jgi:WD40 repeat protein